MFWYSLYVALAFMLDLFQVHQLTPNEKDLKILFLQQQLAIIRRLQKRRPIIILMEKLVLATLVHELKISEQSIK